MAEGYPVQSHDAIRGDVAPVHDDQFFRDTYGWSPEEAERTISFTSRVTGAVFETTLKQLVTQPAESCPIDFAADLQEAHAADPVNGSKDHLAGIVKYNKAVIGEAKPRKLETDAVIVPSTPKKKTFPFPERLFPTDRKPGPPMDLTGILSRGHLQVQKKL